MAIAFDAATTRSTLSLTTSTWSHTNTGANRILFVGIMSDHLAGADDVLSVAYATVAMVRVGTILDTTAGQRTYLYVLAGATLGANNVVVTFGAGSPDAQGRSVSYTGAAQTNIVDASTTAQQLTGTSPLTGSVTPVAGNCWTVALFRNNGDSAATAGTGTTFRNASGVPQTVMGDSNGALVSGSPTSLNYVYMSTSASMVMASFAPAPTSAGNMLHVF